MNKTVIKNEPKKFFADEPMLLNSGDSHTTVTSFMFVVDVKTLIGLTALYLGSKYEY